MSKRKREILIKKSDKKPHRKTRRKILQFFLLLCRIYIVPRPPVFSRSQHPCLAPTFDVVRVCSKKRKKFTITWKTSRKSEKKRKKFCCYFSDSCVCASHIIFWIFQINIFAERCCLYEQSNSQKRDLERISCISRRKTSRCDEMKKKRKLLGLP